FAAGTLCKVSFRAILAGQKSAGQGIIRDNANSISPANRLEGGFVIRAIVQIVKWLQRFISWKPMFSAGFQCFRQPWRGIIGDSNGADFSLFNELTKRFQRFL